MKILMLRLGLVCCALGISSAGITADRGITASKADVVRQSVFQVEKRDAPQPGEMVSVIVNLDVDSVAAIAALTGQRLEMSSPAALGQMARIQRSIQDFEAESRRVIPAARITHRYTTVIGGVSMIVPAEEVATVRSLSGVEAVYPDELQQLDTERSPFFIGASRQWGTLGGKRNAGTGVIVGVIDTGIWPEHPSFSDPDAAGKPYPSPPVTWSGTTCEFGNTAWNPNDAPFSCNNKLIGADMFLDTYKAVIGLTPTEFDSARDSNGHGTHTQSTSSGNHSVPATLLGVPRGKINGISPRSHVVMYKACGTLGCFTSDTSAAVQQAIADGVDVINYSISGGGNPYGDATSLAFLDAYNAGILVTPSAGNSGPGPDTVAHREPWTLTVGASTTDRHFISDVALTADNSDTLSLNGASVTDGISTPTDVIFPPAGEELCLNPFAPGTFSGEIVICERGVIARVAKSFNVQAGGGGGMLLYNPAPIGLATDNHFIPSVHLESDQGQDLLDFMATHTGVTGTFTPGSEAVVQGDVMAAFSSRGGPGQTLGISKPDVTAPGVQILAGHTPLPEDETGGLPGELFQAIQGTSMSAPHTAGAAALVKAQHPDWGPGQIKSALMTSAKTNNVFKEDAMTSAGPFDRGSGRIRPFLAGRTQLTISESGANFLALEENLWDANTPSIFIPRLPGVVTVSRTLHNETGVQQNWAVRITRPADVKIKINPTSPFVLPANGDMTFDIEIDASKVPVGEVRHAFIKLSSGNRQPVKIPISFVRVDNELVTLDKSCSPLSIPHLGTTSCTITVQNQSFDTAASVHVRDDVPRQFFLRPNTVVGAAVTGNSLETDVVLAPGTPPGVSVAIDGAASPFGYVPLSSFTPTDVGATDESIANFGVPTFDYAGVSYDTIGIVSNGYVVVGGGSGADVNFINSDLPDGALPNNVLAPFWTDLNPAAGGTVWIELLTDTIDTWIVVEWEAVPNFGDGMPNTAQVWIGINTDTNPAQDISFTYATVSGGDGGFLTVGAENAFGNSGGTTYFNGVGTPPAPSFGGGNPACETMGTTPPCYEVDVSSTPGAPGGSHVISFDLRGRLSGDWQNCAEMSGDTFPFIATDCESIYVQPDP